MLQKASVFIVAVFMPQKCGRRKMPCKRKGYAAGFWGKWLGSWGEIADFGATGIKIEIGWLLISNPVNPVKC